MIQRSDINWITEAGMFFEKKGPVWETLHELQARLDEAGIAYVVIGGLALNAHNYPRQTVDVDIVLTAEDMLRFRERFAGKEYAPDVRLARRFVDPATEVAIDVLVAGELAGRRDRNATVRFPSPDEAEVHRDLRTVSLGRLIELKLVTWRFKDWGDVVELIRRNDLPESLAEKLDPVVRSGYRECWDQARDQGYEEPLGQPG